MKDEGLNPTGSFKARGMIVRGLHGRASWASRSGGSFGGKRCRRDGSVRGGVRVWKRTYSCPEDVPQANLIECKAFGRAM